MRITFTETRKYGDGIGLKHAGESKDVTTAQGEQFIKQGLAVSFKSSKEKQTAKPATAPMKED